MSTPFDTLAKTRRLDAAGIATKQAEAIVVAIQESRDTAATKRDLDTNVAALRSDLEASFAALRSEITVMAAELRSDIGKLQNDTCKAIWVQGAASAIIFLASEIL